MTALHVILVHSTGYAIKIEKILKQNNVACKLVPVPRHLSSDCGVYLQFDSDRLEAVNRLLQDYRLKFEGLYPL